MSWGYIMQIKKSHQQRMHPTVYSIVVPPPPHPHLTSPLKFCMVVGLGSGVGFCPFVIVGPSKGRNGH